MTVHAYALRVDGQEVPQGVIRPPRFSWRLRSDSGRRGARQEGYRITVSLRLPGGEALVWDSGWRRASDSVGIRYGGVPLVTSADYRWVLDVEDETGERTREESGFATGIVHADEWSAAWIARNPSYRHVALPPQDTDITYTVNKLQPVRRFVRHIDLDELPARAKVHASAKGVYRLYINGHRVGRDELVPGWTEYRDRITYQSWDVTGLLRRGRNSIAALLGDGWYVGFIGTDRRQQAQHYGKTPAFLAQLVIDETGGGRRVVGTDGTWRESPSDILYADLLMGQYEDSRRADAGWCLPEHDIEGWSPAIVESSDTGLLVPEEDPAVRATETVGAVSVHPRPDGRIIVDFGQNLVGRVRLALRGQPSGTRVQLQHAEMLDERGEIYTANLRTAEPVDVFWTNGDASQTFEPRFTLHGFRYVEVSGVSGELDVDDIVAVVLHNEMEQRGRIETSSPDLNRLCANIDWGLRGNFVSIPTDCPQRDERLGWLADAQVFAPTALLLRDTGPLLARWLRDVRSAQTEGGAFPDIAPHLIHLREGAPAWGDGGVTIPWSVYRASGDVEVLRDAVDSMVRWVAHVHRHNPDLIWREQVGNDYGDWLQVGEETRKDVLATAYFARSAAITARVLRILGRNDEAEEHEALAERIRQVYRRAFIDEDGTVAGDTQGGYLLTLAFGLCAPGEERDAVAARLVEAIERRGVSLTSGFITVGLLCPVLAEIGRDDLAFRLLHNDAYPSWLFSVRNGATTIWERWDGWTPESGFQSPRMNSFNHYSLGSVGEWLFEGILGIRQTDDSAGYRELRLAPRLDPELQWAGGSLETARGLVVSRWRKGAAGVTWEVSVPPGADATAVVPGCAAAEVTESGIDLASAEGIGVLADRPSETLLRLSPGSYILHFPAR